LTDQLDLGDDSLGEVIALKPFGSDGNRHSALSLYEIFSKRKLAFDLGSFG